MQLVLLTCSRASVQDMLTHWIRSDLKEELQEAVCLCLQQHLTAE
jgi:hypothetical protein